MSGSVNKCILIGNVGADPEIRRTQDGKAIANIRLATSESWRDKSTGERKEKTEWHRVVCFNEQLNKIIEAYVHKGSKIYVEGALQTRRWTDQQGVEKFSTEVVLQGFNAVLQLLDKPGDAGSREPDAEPAGNAYAAASGRTGGGARPSLSEDMGDSIPFACEWR